MKYSLELSDPWISQYHNKREREGMGLLRNTRKLHRLWITDDADELRKFLLNTSTLDHLEGWR